MSKVEAPVTVEHEKSFSERLASLLAVDCYRVTRILETTQYAALYAIICLPVGLLIDYVCGLLYPKEDEQGLLRGAALARAIAVAVMQVVLSAVSIIYVRKLADLVPFVFNLCPWKYVPHYHVEEVFGEVAIALIFVGIQVSLVKKLEQIRKSLLPEKGGGGEHA